MSNKKFDLFTKIDELPSRLYVILGIIFIAGYTALCAYTNLSPIKLGLSLLLLYSLVSGLVFLLTRKRIAMYRAENRASEEQNSGVISASRDKVSLPYVIVTEKGLRVVDTNKR